MSRRSISASPRRRPRRRRGTPRCPRSRPRRRCSSRRTGLRLGLNHCDIRHLGRLGHQGEPDCAWKAATFPGRARWPDQLHGTAQVHPTASRYARRLLPRYWRSRERGTLVHISRNRRRVGKRDRSTCRSSSATACLPGAPPPLANVVTECLRRNDFEDPPAIDPDMEITELVHAPKLVARYFLNAQVGLGHADIHHGLDLEPDAIETQGRQMLRPDAFHSWRGSV